MKKEVVGVCAPATSTTRKSWFQVAILDYTRLADSPQDHLGELAEVFSTLDDSALLARLQEYRPVGRPGYPLRALWQAYVASFILNLPHTNALIRRLEDEPAFRYLCGFQGELPHRTTFNRFIQRLSHHTDLVEACFAPITDQLKALIPDMGDQVAIDATTVRSHCNPNRRKISDPEASWTAKNSARAKEGGKEWHHGYKVHMVADAQHGLPLAHVVTTAKRNDTLELPAVIERAEALYPWFRPSVAIADKGYDSASNHDYLHQKGIVPIINIRKKARGGLREGIYDEKGNPTCLGQVSMEYVRSDPEKGHLYRCRAEGCHLKDSNRGGIRHCDSEVWEDPKQNIRLFGVLRRNSKEWKAFYSKRQSIERVFKSMKESRRLERHCIRGLRQVTLHCTMSAMAFQVTALVRVLAGELGDMCWMVRRVA